MAVNIFIKKDVSQLNHCVLTLFNKEYRDIIFIFRRLIQIKFKSVEKSK